MAGVNSLKNLLAPSVESKVEFDPKDSANKFPVGGALKLTKRGEEICYRLFDAGKSRYAVAELMAISFGAVTHRYKVWNSLGGIERVKQPLE